VTQPTNTENRDKLLRLVLQENISVNAAAMACGISRRTAGRILDSHGTIQSQAVPFSGDPQPTAHVPPPNWTNDQPRPVPSDGKFDRGYHGHTFQSFSAPMSFQGFDLNRIRKAVMLHRLGNFLESSTLALVILSCPPVLAALGQRMAPALALPRHIRAGARGLSRILGEQVESQLAPRAGLTPSEYFPPTLWGGLAFDLAFMGFSVMQHAYGAPDEDTGVMPVYTRRWPTWAVQYWRYRKTYTALTTNGPVDILNDGKFTLVADSEEPHFLGAINALGEEAFDAMATKRARAAYIDKYGNPKWIGTMPEGVAPNSPEGKSMEAALATIRGPDGFGVMPFGAGLDLKGLESGRSTVLKDALESNWMYIAATLLGSDGTMTRGTGVYSAPIFAGVRRDLVDRDLKAIIRAVNAGHIGGWLNFNHSTSISIASGWVAPVLDIPLPDPDKDARIKSFADRVSSFQDAISKEKSNGFEISQDRVNQLAAQFEIEPPTLASLERQAVRIDLAPTDIAKVVKVREARAANGLPLLGDDRDDMTIAELDALSKSKASTAEELSQGEPGASDAPSDAPVEGAHPATEGAATASSERTQNGGTSTGGETKPAADAPAT